METTPKLSVLEEKDGLLVLSSPTAPRFKLFSMGLGYADPTVDESLHACVLAGKTSDDRIIILAEFLGILEDVLWECVNLKDRFIVKRLWVDTKDKELLRLILDMDGLTKYRSLGLNNFGDPIYENSSKTWPFFRDRSTLLFVTGIPSFIQASPLGGIDRLVGMVKKGELTLHSSCGQCAWILDQQTVGEVIKRPLTKAMVYAINGFSSEDEADRKPFVPTNVYGNLT